MSLGFLIEKVCAAEAAARMRELRALSLVLLGAHHPAVEALNQATANPAMHLTALNLLDALPPRPKRRLLAAFAASLPARRGRTP